MTPRLYFGGAATYSTNVLVQFLLKDGWYARASPSYYSSSSGGTHLNSANLVSQDVGHIKLLEFAPRIAVLHSTAVRFSAALLISTETLLLWHAGGVKLVRVLDVTV